MSFSSKYIAFSCFHGSNLTVKSTYFFFFPKWMNSLVPKWIKRKNWQLDSMNYYIIFTFIIKRNKNYLFPLNLFMMDSESRKYKTSYSNDKINHQIISTRKYWSCCNLPRSCKQPTFDLFGWLVVYFSKRQKNAQKTKDYLEFIGSRACILGAFSCLDTQNFTSSNP